MGIYDHSTGEYKTVELTDEEQAEKDETVAASIVAKEQAVLEAQQLRATKIAAYEKLGLTEAEIEALLPKPELPIS